jgi:hypothetical protein
MAMAMAPSVPGLIGIHSAAREADSQRRGSTTTSLAPSLTAFFSRATLRCPAEVANSLIPNSRMNRELA